MCKFCGSSDIPCKCLDLEAKCNFCEKVLEVNQPKFCSKDCEQFYLVLSTDDEPVEVVFIP